MMTGKSNKVRGPLLPQEIFLFGKLWNSGFSARVVTIPSLSPTCNSPDLKLIRGGEMAKTNPMKVKVLEHFNVSPSPGSVPHETLPLTFFDLPWLPPYPYVKVLFFYELAQSTPHFTNTILSKLKDSLSHTLHYFYPLAGHLIWPSESLEPEIRFNNRDSVSLTFAECNCDFYHLSGNHAREAYEFHHLVHDLQSSFPFDSPLPLLALQVTVFPNSGISIGVTASHVVFDGTTLIHFMRSWASICRLGIPSLSPESIPFYGRNIINDRDGLKTIYLNELQKHKEIHHHQLSSISHPDLVPVDVVKVTFVVSPDEIERLRQWVLSLCKNREDRPSTFTLICAHLWICWIKSRPIEDSVARSNKEEIILMALNCRIGNRLDPPVPMTYFGTCLSYSFPRVKRSDLMGEDGIAIAVEVIMDSIKKRLEDGVLEGAETMMDEAWSAVSQGAFTVAGSSRLGVYEMDFGWGRPNKYESIGDGGSGRRRISVCDGKDGEGSVEVGVVLPRLEMDAFASFFENGFRDKL